MLVKNIIYINWSFDVFANYNPINYGNVLFFFLVKICYSCTTISRYYLRFVIVKKNIFITINSILKYTSVSQCSKENQ